MMPALIQASRLFSRIDRDRVQALSSSLQEKRTPGSNPDTISCSEEDRREYVAECLMSTCEMAFRLKVDPELALRDYVSNFVEESDPPD